MKRFRSVPALKTNRGDYSTQTSNSSSVGMMMMAGGRGFGAGGGGGSARESDGMAAFQEYQGGAAGAACGAGIVS